MSTGIGKRIRDRRKELGLSQEALAERLGLKSKSTICKIETGDDNLSTTTIKKYAEALNCTPAYLMGWKMDLQVFASGNDFEKAWKDLGGGRHPIDLTDEEYSLIVELRACKDTESQKNRLLEYALKLGGQKK